MKSLPFLLLCAPLLALASCKTGGARQFRLMYAHTNAEDDFGFLDGVDADQTGGVEFQVLGALKEGDDTLYGVVGLGYQFVDSDFDGVDLDKSRTSFHGGVEKQFPLNETARFLVQGGIMYNELELEVAGLTYREDAFSLYAALGLQVQFNEGLSGTIMYRPLEPGIDDGNGGKIDTEALLIGVTLLR